mmetsp:Transcript_8073/g.12059  ORF Transcript_8073/g.12059 Transcript_8073/m.12059 type:complete len:354 (-) Transcript_8073:1503-2564(-)
MLSRWFLFILVAVFIFSGLSSPLLIEIIHLNGGYFSFTMLVALPLCLGQSMAIFTNWSSRFEGVLRWKYILLVTILDMISYALNTNGLVYAGSATYTIIHSSLTVFTAMLSFYFLEVKPNRVQYSGIIMIIIGLSVALYNANCDGIDVLFGAILILLGTMMHSMTYIISEYILVKVEDAVSPELLCSISGLIPATFYTFWQLIYTVPHYQTVVLDNIHRAHGNSSIILTCYVLLGVAAFFHSTLFYFLIHHMGSTSTSVSKILQSLVLFISSHLFCHPNRKAQCLTTSKGVSFAIVLVGVLLYSLTHAVLESRKAASYTAITSPPTPTTPFKSPAITHKINRNDYNAISDSPV